KFRQSGEQSGGRRLRDDEPGPQSSRGGPDSSPDRAGGGRDSRGAAAATGNAVEGYSDGVGRLQPVRPDSGDAGGVRRGLILGPGNSAKGPLSMKAGLFLSVEHSAAPIILDLWPGPCHNRSIQLL